LFVNGSWKSSQQRNSWSSPSVIAKHEPAKGGEKKKETTVLGGGELREKILIAFQDKENVKLLKRSKATFYDEFKTVNVGCYTSKLHEKWGKQSFWFFAPSKKVVNFLQNGSKGYLLFGLEKQTKAVAFPVERFDEIKGKLNPKYDQDRSQILWWYLKIFNVKGNLEIRLKGKQRIDLSQYVFDLE